MSAKSIAERGHPLVWWIISVGLFIAIWELTFAMGLYSARTLPPPHVFLGDLPNQIQYFDFSKANAGEAAPPTPYHAVAKTISATVLRVVAGLGLGFVLGVVSGTLIRYFRWFGNLTLPTVTLLAPISPFAWLPVAMMIFGLGNAPAIFLVYIALFFIMTLATLSLIDTLQPSYVQVARIMGASRLQIFIQVILPAILPGLFVVLRLNLFAAWMIVLIAESVGVGGGLGLVVIISRNTFDAQLAFFTMLIIGGIGFVLDAALREIQRRALYWQP